MGLSGSPAAEDVEAASGRALVLPVYVAEADGVEQAAAETEEKLGPIDVWVNKAMATVYGTVEEISPEEFRRATEVTYPGSGLGTMAALRRMRSREPAPGEFAAHGRFDDRSKRRSFQLWATTHRHWLLGGAVAAALAWRARA